MERMRCPLAVDIPPATSAPPVANALPATGGPDPWDGVKKVHMWFHAMGRLRWNQEVPRLTLA